MFSTRYRFIQWIELSTFGQLGPEFQFFMALSCKLLGSPTVNFPPRLQNSRFFFSKSVKKSVKRGVRVLRARSARASHARRACEAREVSLSVFSLIPDLLFDCSRVLEYAKIRTVLQSISPLERISGSLRADEIKLWLTPSAKQRRNPCSGLPAVYPDLSTRHDWPVKKGLCFVCRDRQSG